MRGLLTYTGGESAIQNPGTPVLDLINAQGQPAAIGSPYAPPEFIAPFGTTLNLNSLQASTTSFMAGDEVSLIVYQGTAIFQLPPADFTVNIVSNTITLNSNANLTGVTAIAVSIATQAYHANGDPQYYAANTPLQVGEPLVDSSGNPVIGTNGQVELYTAATIGNNATQIFDYGTAPTETFTLNAAPDGYIDVTIAGTDLPADEISVSGNNVTVTPSFIPAQGSPVVITYRMSIMYNQAGSPIYLKSPNGIWVQATYSGGEPEYYLGTEPVLYLGGEQAYCTNTQPLPVAADFHAVTISGGMPGTIDFRGVASLTISGGTGNNTYTIVQTHLGASARSEPTRPRSRSTPATATIRWPSIRFNRP